MDVVALADLKEIIRHYWQEFPRPKEVRDVLEDISHDIEASAFDSSEIDEVSE